MIPPFDGSGHLPPGRTRCTLEEFADRFVLATEYSASETRRNLFAGLVKYLTNWEEIESKTGVTGLLSAFWVAGSFVSPELHPDDIDISPIVDGTKTAAIKRKPGSGQVKDLTQHRESIKKRFGVEVFPILWHPVLEPFKPGQAVEGMAYLTDRGTMDDWWQRVRPDGPKGPATLASAPARRGYLEVVV